MLRGVRGRIAVTIIGLVALTSLVLGLASYLYVSTSLRGQQLQSARDVTNFNVAVLAAERLPARPTKADLIRTRLIDAFALRGVNGAVVDFGDGDPFNSDLDALNAFRSTSPELRAIVDGGSIGYQRLVVDGKPLLVTGARLPPSGPGFYFLFDSTEVEGAIDRLAQALAVGGLILVVLAALAGRAVARRLLEPVARAGAAAQRIAGGDLSARLAVASGDEFGRWAASFNEMAASLQDKVAELQAAGARERRFVADVSHELRTPLTALINEASLLRGHLDALPAPGRRVGELLVLDIGRLRALVDDLMEISRFDAAAEGLQPTEFDMEVFIRAVVAARAPEALVSMPGDPSTIVADRRRLERVLANLLDNARVHGEGRRIEVVAGVEADADGHEELVAAVLDGGPGVPPAELPLLFERFHKADPSRHRGGSGLGLAIAWENARLLGGTLTTMLRPAGGMRFELRVPVTRSLPLGDWTVTVEGQPPEVSDARTESSP